VLRIDASQIDAQERTDEGYVRAEGIIAAPGLLEYRTKAGETVREYVPEETLKYDEFLASLEGKPVTVEHPPAALGPDNVSEYAVGTVREDYRRSRGGTRCHVNGSQSDPGLSPRERWNLERPEIHMLAVGTIAARAAEPVPKRPERVVDADYRRASGWVWRSRTGLSPRERRNRCRGAQARRPRRCRGPGMLGRRQDSIRASRRHGQLGIGLEDDRPVLVLSTLGSTS